MPEIDKFASLLLEEAKRFLEIASRSSTPEGEIAHLHAAMLVGLSALEAHVSAMAEDFLTLDNLSAQERAILREREVRLEDGEFVVTESLKMYRLEDRIQFLHRRFSGKAIDRKTTWWSELGSAIKLRNELTHPKGSTTISKGAVERALQAIIDTLAALFDAVYGEKFPAAGRRLQSKMNF